MGTIVVTLGYVLIAVGIAGLLIGFLMSLMRRSRRVTADRGSVAVGRDNNAPITLTTFGAKSSHGVSVMDIWNIVCGATSILGLALVLWPHS